MERERERDREERRRREELDDYNDELDAGRVSGDIRGDRAGHWRQPVESRTHRSSGFFIILALVFQA